MGLIFNRLVSIYRPRIPGAPKPGTLPAPGLQDGYSGVNQGPNDGLDLIAKDVPAGIQYVSQARAMGAQLPDDVQNKTNWDIYLPAKRSPLGLVKTRDVVIDELCNHYQVTVPDWGLLGYRLRCELEEA